LRTVLNGAAGRGFDDVERVIGGGVAGSVATAVAELALRTRFDVNAVAMDYDQGSLLTRNYQAGIWGDACLIGLDRRFNGASR